MFERNQEVVWRPWRLREYSTRRWIRNFVSLSYGINHPQFLDQSIDSWYIKLSETFCVPFYIFGPPKSIDIIFSDQIKETWRTWTLGGLLISVRHVHCLARHAYLLYQKMTKVKYSTVYSPILHVNWSTYSSYCIAKKSSALSCMLLPELNCRLYSSNCSHTINGTKWEH